MTIDKSIEELKVNDTISLILFTVFKLRDLPEYATLSELAYLLDNNSLINLLKYYGGMTIKIPTLRELRLIINVLLMYQMVNLEGEKWKKAYDSLDLAEYTKDEVKEVYEKICEVLSTYDFSRE